jgi:hypothetical protein
VQSRSKIILIKVGKWAFLGAGMLGVFFSLVAWFLVPGAVDLNRLLVAGLFASLATNAFLLSGLFFCVNSEDGLHTLKSSFRTPPIIIAGLFLFTFVVVAATAPWWAKH